MSSDLEQLIVQNFGGLEQLKEQVALLVWSAFIGSLSNLQKPVLR
jgi:hypothetical protein